MDDNQRLSTLFSFAMILATATLGWFTLKDSAVPRVGDSRLSVPVSADEQDVVARLWEDPLQAVQQAAAKASSSSSPPASDSNLAPATPPPPKHSLAGLQKSVEEVLAKNPSHQLALLVVPIPDTPYPDDFETRLRLRYSIQMALADRNYAPTSRSYLGYIHLKPTDLAAGSTQLGSVVPYEWFQPRQAQKAIAPGMQEVSVLVLWVPEGRLARAPLQLLADLTSQLVADQTTRFNGVFMIGPQSSDTLKALIRDAKDKTNTVVNGEFLKDRLAIFSGRATAPDGVLELKSDPRWKYAREDLAVSLHDKFAGSDKSWRYFHNCIATDDQLTDLIAVELTLRGIQPGRDEILVLAEADTAYGRSLPIALQASVDSSASTRSRRVTTAGSFATATSKRITAIMDPPPADPKAGNGPPPIEQPLLIYRYLRGLDQQKGQTQNNDKTASPPNAKTPEELLALALTRQGAMALGESQLDYVDRLVLDIERDASKRNAIRAVGVLGADIYDKMILLRSLRPRFPDAVFFTTDLDARLWHPDHLRFTRNLVVASATNVRGVERDLNPAQIPPFRDAYQVAVFTACREALVLAARSAVGKTTRAPLPVIFEIGREGPVPLISFTSEEPTRHWPGLHSKSTIAFIWILFCLLCATGLYVLNYRIQPPVFSRFGFGVALAVCVVALFSLATYYEFPARLDAEPWSLHAGISIWPTEILRLIIICTAVLAVSAARKYHREFRARLAKRYFLGNFESTPTHLPSPRTFVARLRPLLGRAWTQVEAWRARQQAARHGDSTSDENNNETHVATVVFAEYVARARPFPRIARVLFATVVYLALGLLLMIFLHGSLPLNTHIRGDFARIMDKFFLFGSICCFLGFVFYVLDAVFITALLLDKIKRRTAWPPLLLQKKRQQFQVRNEDLDGYLDVSFAAEISADIGKLIYLPFIIQFMFILSRNSYFDHWTWPTALIAVFVGNFMLACVAWGVLRHSAKGIRTAALQDLKHAVRDAGQEAAVHQEGRIRHKHLLRMRKLIEEEHRGAYSRFIQDPALLAMLLPSGVFGIAVIIGRVLFSGS